MRLLNFSIGRVQTVQLGADVIRTAHLKAPAPEPWRITEDGAAGDQRAVHPDKIYAFARAHYDYWGAELGIDPARWPDGFFGENLTLDTLDESDVRVGDVFALGDEVRLVVAGARTPCAKLAWRLSQPRTFQQRFARSRHAGMYMGVLTPGTVRPGDEMRRIAHDQAMPSVADVCDYIADRDPPPLEPLRRLLAHERLSPANRVLLGAKLEAAEQAAIVRAGGWRGWRRFIVERIVDEAPSIRSFHLRPEDGGAILRARPGQHVAVRLPTAAGMIVRHWSLSRHAVAGDHYRITVCNQGGLGSTLLHDARPGMPIELRMPAGNFLLDEGSFRPVILIAGGIGITPLMAMLEAQLARSQDSPVRLIYGARTPDDVAFRAEIDRLAAADRRLKVDYLYSRADSGAAARGRITPDRVIQLVQGLEIVVEGHRVELPWHEAMIYICGPDGLCESLCDGLVERGGNPDLIARESFAAPVAEATDLAGAEIRFARSGRSATWTAEDDMSLLELAEAAGVAIPSDCRAGACLTCRTVVIDGAATVDAGDGATLPCIARPRTTPMVLDA